MRAAHLYHQRTVEYFALRVILRGLFLAVAIMMAFVYVLGLATDVLPGVNEIAVPTTTVPAEVDVGQVVREIVNSTTGRFVSVLGTITLIISGFYTARALRQGAVEIFGESGPPRSRPVQWSRDAGLAALVALLVLFAWLFALATAIRTSAIIAILGTQVPRAAVNVGKWCLLLISIALVAAVVYALLRKAAPGRRTRDVLLASVLFGVFMTAANLFLLYAYVASIIDPHTSSGVVLVLTVLAWVNIVIRALFYAECWIVTPRDPAES